MSTKLPQFDGDFAPLFPRLLTKVSAVGRHYRVPHTSAKHGVFDVQLPVSCEVAMSANIRHEYDHGLKKHSPGTLWLLEPL